jgi:hypothetical protein
VRHSINILATIAFIFFTFLSPAVSETCDEIAGWWTLVTLANACKRAGFPLEQEERIRKGFDAMAASSDTASLEWGRGRDLGKQHGMRLFNAGVLADSPAFSCARGSEMAEDWLPNAVAIMCR